MRARKDGVPPSIAFPVAGGTTGADMRAFDWTPTVVGAPETWPPTLRSSIGLILNSPESMFLAWGPALSFFFNDAYRPLLGAKLDRALGSTLPTLWAEVWGDVRENVEKALAGIPSRFEDLPLTMARNGVEERTWWSFSYSPLYDEDGAVRGMFCVTRETTNRVLTDMALRTSEQRYRAVFESAIDYAIIVADLDGTIVDLNEGGRRILGWEKDEMIGRSIEMFFTPEDRIDHIALKEMRSALESGRGVDERWHLRADGTTFWANGEMLTLRDEANKAIGFLKILRDRTEQRNSQAQLQASEAKLRTIVETIPIGILLAEAPTGRIVGRNQRMDDIFGPSSNAPRSVDDYGKWLAFHADGRKVEPAEFPLARVIQGGLNEASLQVDYQRRDGSRVWLELVAAAVRDAEGTLTGAVVAVNDIQARKTAEAMQGLMSAELSHRMKNLMTMVLAVTNQTMRTAVDVAVAREILSDRLIALSKAHDLLLGGSATGATVEAVVREGVATLEKEESERIRLRGPSVEIGPRPALALAMMMHELCTNATKYGALSVPEGQVHIDWSLAGPADAPDLCIEWREEGGPSVTPPTRVGFGSRLIERGLTGHVGGTVETRFEPTGVVCAVRAALVRFKAAE